MFDHKILDEILKEYKSEFVENRWPDEKYKWQAIQHFQSVWDINALNLNQDFECIAQQLNHIAEEYF